MIEVEQRRDDDCLIACVASVLEIPYEDVPVELRYEDGQMTAFLRFMRERGWEVANYSLCGAAGLPDEPQPETPRSWPTYWFASVLSPRLTFEDGSPGWHVVVMRGRELVWDPHPLREQGHLGFVGAEVLLASDPARFVLRSG